MDRWTFFVFRLERAVNGGLIVSVRTVGLHMCSAWTVLHIVDVSSVNELLDIDSYVCCI